MSASGELSSAPLVRLTPISDTFARRIFDTFGDAGRAWLAALPDILVECERRWALTVQAPFPDLSYNFVAPALREDGTDAVLKLGVPTPELSTEIAALRLYDGRGAVRLWEADESLGALFLERLRPGTQLYRLENDGQATVVAAEVMQLLWRKPPPDHAFPSVETWAQGLARLRTRFDGGTGPLPEHLVTLAETLFRDLLASMDEAVVLHGDLHHYNILQSERQPWSAIDPKGVIGEPAYEVGALLRNPFPHLLTWPDLDRILARRVALLSEVLGFDEERIVGWGVAQAVLAAWWSLEDGGDWAPWLACAERMEMLL